MTSLSGLAWGYTIHRDPRFALKMTIMVWLDAIPIRLRRKKKKKEVIASHNHRSILNGSNSKDPTSLKEFTLYHTPPHLRHKGLDRVLGNISTALVPLGMANHATQRVETGFTAGALELVIRVAS